MNSDPRQVAWMAGLRDDVAGFMAALHVKGQPGRFLPCRQGAVGAGQNAALGFACFANKIYYSIGLWDTLTPDEQLEWLDFIASFQVKGTVNQLRHAFVDHHLLESIELPWEPLPRRLLRWWPGGGKKAAVTAIILAETKQAIATLAQVGRRPVYPFCSFPRREKALLDRLRGFDWSQPWGAGAKTAILSLLIQTQGACFQGGDQGVLAGVVGRFLDDMVDSDSGGYFLPPNAPQRGQLINGAMKVLNALDWLEKPIHYPERLIDTCLLQGPPRAGCHVVDWVYVVHRCGLQTSHRRLDIQAACQEIIGLIQSHQNRDRGFAYVPGQAQQGYYGAKISLGLDEGDIHGTCLLIWALAMIMDILELNHFGWKVLRP